MSLSHWLDVIMYVTGWATIGYLLHAHFALTRRVQEFEETRHVVDEILAEIRKFVRKSHTAARGEERQH